MATGSSYPSTGERTNYGRLCRVIVDLCTDMLRDQLRNKVNPRQLLTKVYSCTDYKKKKFYADEVQNLNTAVKTSNYKSFDISLLYKLLSTLSVQELRDELAKNVAPKMLWTNVQTDQILMSQLKKEQVKTIQFVSTMGDYSDCDCFLLSCLVCRLCPGYVPTLLPSSGKWGGNTYPQPTHIELGDDIERIRLLRNKVYGHVTDTCVTDVDFNTYWKELFDITQRLDQKIKTGGRYTKDLQDIESASLDENWDMYMFQINKLSESEKEIQVEVEEVQEKVISLDTKQQELYQKQIALDQRQALSDKKRIRLNQTQMKMGSQMEEIDSRVGSLQVKVTSLEKKENVLYEKQVELDEKNALVNENQITLNKTQIGINSQLEEMNSRVGNMQTNLSSLDGKHKFLYEKQVALDDEHVFLNEEQMRLNERQMELNSHMQETDSRVTTLGIAVSGFKEGCVPSHIKEQNNIIASTWKEEDEVFIETRATEKVLDFIDKNNTLTLTGNAGTGKSATIQHVALLMEKDKRYEIFSVNSPAEIKTYLNPMSKQLFVVDNPIGVHSLDTHAFEKWVQYNRILKCLLKGNVKLLCSIRQQVINELDFKKEKCILNQNIVSLNDKDCDLNKEEKVSMIKKHLKVSECEDNIIRDLEINLSEKMAPYPLICQLYCSSANYREYGIDFFLNPFHIVLQDLQELKSKDKVKYCTLVMCFAYENNLDPNLFDPFEICELSNTSMFEGVMEVCEVNRHGFVGALKRNLESLTGVYLKQQGQSYQFIHDLVYDVVTYHFGNEYQNQMLKLSPSRFICERVVVQKEEMHKCSHVVELKTKYMPTLLERLIIDLDNGFHNYVMRNKCWDNDHFIDLFIKDFELNKKRFQELFCKKLINRLEYIHKIEDDLENLIHKGDITQICSWNCEATCFLNLSGITLLHWTAVYSHRRLFEILWQNLSPTDKEKVSEEVPLFHCACLGGDINICTNILQDTDCNVSNVFAFEDSEGNIFEVWPLQLAAITSANITKFVLDKGADVNVGIQRESNLTSVRFSAEEIDTKTDMFLVLQSTALLLASQNGNTEVAQLLFQYNASVDIQTDDGISALMLASRNGHPEVVHLLLSHNASVDIQMNDGSTALMVASIMGIRR